MNPDKLFSLLSPKQVLSQESQQAYQSKVDTAKAENKMIKEKVVNPFFSFADKSFKKIMEVLNPGESYVAPALKKIGVNPILAGGIGLGVDILAPGPGELGRVAKVGKEVKVGSELLQEAKKYKSAEEFVKAQNKTATGAKVPDTLKVYALDDKDLGQIYRQSGIKSSAYPADFVAKNDIPELKIKKGDKVSIIANDKDAKRFTIENIPERKTESGAYSKSAQIGDLVDGYSRQDQIDFINKNFSKEVLTKSQLTDIFNKAHNITK